VMQAIANRCAPTADRGFSAGGVAKMPCTAGRGSCRPPKHRDPCRRRIVPTKNYLRDHEIIEWHDRTA
jgi:hypothetical protein